MADNINEFTRGRGRADRRKKAPTMVDNINQFTRAGLVERLRTEGRCYTHMEAAAEIERLTSEVQRLVRRLDDAGAPYREQAEEAARRQWRAEADNERLRAALRDIVAVEGWQQAEARTIARAALEGRDDA